MDIGNLFIMGNRCSPEMCPCGEVILEPSLTTVYVVDDGLIARVEVCDECRRKICTCDTCSGAMRDSDGDLQCRSCIPRVTYDANEDTFWDDWAFVNDHEWCRDGYRQARPLTLADIEERFGGEKDGE